MSNADRTILKAILEQDWQQRHSDLSRSEYFEIFSAEQVLKYYNLDSDEVESGRVGGPDDGGVDLVYFFLDKRLVRADEQVTNHRHDNMRFDLVVIQAKQSPGFTERAVGKLRDFTADTLDLGRDFVGLAEVYSAPFLETIKLFRDIYLGALSLHPTLSISFYYVTQGDVPHPKVTRKAEQLKERIAELYGTAQCTFEFITARGLLDLFNSRPPTTVTLRVSKTMASSHHGTAYVCLVPIGEFFKFITTDPNDLLRTELRGEVFESNVRDYQGDVAVNKDIQETLVNDRANEFWWLNNGVSVIASKVTSSGDFLTIDDGQVVNGLQTSREIHNYIKSRNSVEGEDRNVLMRVIQTTDDRARDLIIKATNSQTAVSPASLHATDDVQRNIEAYLHPTTGLYYERRKAYYKNMGVRVASIVTIPYMAQALMSIVLREPDNARARPTTRLESRYDLLFDASLPPSLYGRCALVMKKVDAFLRQKGVDIGRRNNTRFYVAMYVTCMALNSPIPTIKAISEIDVDEITDDLLEYSYGKVAMAYEEAGGNDQVAKGSDLKITLQDELKEQLGISE